MADGSAPKPYTEEDVQLVAEAICDAQNNPQHHPWTDFDWKCEACVSELDSPCSRCAKITRTVLDALAEAGRLRSDEVWIVGTDYADDEIFGVTATRAEAERAAIGHDGDLPLHVVRYTVPYPSRLRRDARTPGAVQHGPTGSRGVPRSKARRGIALHHRRVVR